MINLLLAAALIAGEPQSSLRLCGDTDSQNPATLVSINRLPDKRPENPDLRKQGGYARIVAKYEACNAGFRALETERRDAVRRLFMHKTVSKVLIADLSVNPIGVRSTRPLMTITRDSGKSGESWSTDVWNDAILLPFFRIEPNSTIKLDLTFHSSRDYNSSIATGALDVLKRATALLAKGDAGYQLEHSSV